MVQMSKINKNVVPSESVPLDNEGVKCYDYLVENLERDGITQPPEALLRMHVAGYKKNKKRHEFTYTKLKEVLALREKHGLDTITEKEWTHEMTEEEVAKIWDIKAFGEDPEGHPILFDKSGTMDKKLVKQHFMKDDQSHAMLMDFYFRMTERVSQLKKEKSDKTGNVMYKHVIVVDVNKCGVGNLTIAKKVMGEIIAMSQTLYPDALKKMYIVNAGFMFRAGFSVIKMFLDKETEAKISMLGHKWHRELTKDGIGMDQIPESWGGKGIESTGNNEFRIN